jgi:hypothetical protein|tara:strand:+ start:355 stop:510 length:156 start_codon:yes stop_codon:yes gene_type:complete
MIWSIISGIFVVGLCITIWSIWTAPLMPDDYGLKEEDIWPGDEMPNKEEQD